MYINFQKFYMFFQALKFFGSLSLHGIIFQLFSLIYNAMKYVLQDPPIVYEKKCSYFWVLRFVKF